MRRAALRAAVAAWAAAAAEAAGYAPLPLENGAYGAVELTPHVWTAGACSRDAWVDFYVEVDASSAASNLFFEVVLDAPDGMAAVVPDALELAVFVGAVDESRATELRSESTQDRALSFAINSQEVGAGRYYASVRCAPHSDGYGFGVLVERIPEALDAGGAAADGAICGDELLFHSYDAAALAADESLRFEVCLPAGSAAAVKLMAKVGHPPLRVAAPAVSLDGGGCRTFDVCRDELDGGLAYVALYGEGACTAYNASAAPFAGACDLELGDLDGGAYRDAAADLALERVAYASCEPYGWRDFRVPLEPADLATNLLFEVLDVTGATSRGTNPEALSVHVFRDEIPEDRVTQNRAERSASATYAVFKSFVSLLAMRNATALYVSVRCGHEPARFRLFGERVTAALAPDRVVRGEVCPGNFIYHYVDVPGDAAAAGKVNVAFEVLAFEGSVVFSAAGEPPLRVTPPYASTAGVAPATVTLCYHAVGSPAYVAVSAEGGACATYDVVARWSAASADACELQDPYDAGLRAAALDIHVPLDDACAPRQYQFYSVDVDAARAHDNLLLEVTRADEALDGETPDALSVFVYAGEIPADFASELRADRGVEGAWAVSVAATDLREGTYYVGVRCDALAVRYAVVALLIPAGIAAGAISHGELCPENWVYHALAPLQAAPAGPGGRRALATAAGANATHVRFTIWRLSGDFNAVARHGFPVVYLTPPYHTIAAPDLGVNVDLCDVDADVTQYVGLRGGGECASYNIMADYFYGACAELESVEASATPTVALAANGPVAGSCRAGSFAATDFTYNHSTSGYSGSDNIIFEVQQVLDGRVDERATELRVYAGPAPADRGAAYCSSAAAVRDVHSCTFNYIVVSQIIEAEDHAVLSAAVKCGGLDARFKIAVYVIAAELRPGHHQSGGVCVSAWVFHYYVAAAHAHVKLVVRQYNGDLYRVSARVGKPPMFNSRNVVNIGDDALGPVTDHTLEQTITICDVPPGARVYLGFFGDLGGCSEYDVIPYPFDGACVGGATTARR